MFGWLWLMLICCERKVLLDGWWLVLIWCERKALLLVANRTGGLRKRGVKIDVRRLIFPTYYGAGGGTNSVESKWNDIFLDFVFVILTFTS